MLTTIDTSRNGPHTPLLLSLPTRMTNLNIATTAKRRIPTTVLLPSYSAPTRVLLRFYLCRSLGKNRISCCKSSTYGDRAIDETRMQRMCRPCGRSPMKTYRLRTARQKSDRRCKPFLACKNRNANGWYARGQTVSPTASHARHNLAVHDLCMVAGRATLPSSPRRKAASRRGKSKGSG